MKTQEELLDEARAAIEQRAEEQWARYAVLAEVAEMVEAGRGIPHSTGCNGKTCQPDCPLKTRPVAKKHQPTPNVSVPNNRNARESGGGKREGNIPSKLPANASKGDIKRAALKAIKEALAGKGNQTFWVGNIQYTITQERANHFKKHIGQKLTPEDVADALVLGEYEKEVGRRGYTAYVNGTKIVALDNGKVIGIITAYHEPDERLSKNHKRQQYENEKKSSGEKRRLRRNSQRTRR